MKATAIRVLKGYDFHCHFRRPVVKLVARMMPEYYCGAVAMGNTDPAIANASQAEAYEQEINRELPSLSDFEPIMTIMLIRSTTPQTLIEAKSRGIKVLKYIPLGVSTNSQKSFGMEELGKYYPILRTAEELGIIFSVHWELLLDANGKELPKLFQEAAARPFLDKVARAFPKLKIIVEHASTKAMIDYVRNAPRNVAATLAMHHAIATYQDVCNGNGVILNPHNYCKPILKHEEDRQAVEKAMVSGDPHFFFGSDLAPHPLVAKLQVPPKAGICCTPDVGTSLMVDTFERNNALQKLDDFRCKFGANFYSLEQCHHQLELVRQDWQVPASYNGFVPFMSGQTMHWKVAK